MGWDYQYDKIQEKYSSLILQLKRERESFCSIGTRKAKLRLNKLAKSNISAMLYRKALEIEDKNISAKMYSNYREKYYDEKSTLINKFVAFCVDNNITIGYHCVDDYDIPQYIIYVHLPNCEQISWHTYNKPNCGLYEDKWDGKKESTLPKLEKAILKTFPDLAGDKQND